MRLALVAVTATATFGLVVAGCSSGSETPSDQSSSKPTTGQAATPGGGPVADAFNSANGSASWFAQVKGVTLDGQAVIVRTTLTDANTALAVCEAAYTAGEASGTDFVSVGVRDADDSTLASRNKLSKDPACHS